MTGAALAASAERLISTPFRLHGRDPASGLDCLGLLAAALGKPIPPDYRLRNRDIAAMLALAPRLGLAEVSGAILPGDVLLLEPGPLQHHLAIAGTANRFIHAHAGLRRVVATPGPLGWRIHHHWRLA